MKTTVIHHSANYDGIFCREIAKKFLKDAELIGWDFKDAPLPFPSSERIYILDLPIDRVFGFEFKGQDMLISGKKAGTIGDYKHIVWIDHHKSSIESHPKDIRGYRIDGVAACRLAWQWFCNSFNNYGAKPNFGEASYISGLEKHHFVERLVSEPLAVRLAGEYDIWDHRGDGDIEFQFGLDANANLDLQALLDDDGEVESDQVTRDIVNEGGAAMRCYKKRDADIVRERSFMTTLDGLKVLCLNTARCNSITFAAKDIPETGHDALCGFYFDGKKFTISLYHAAHRKDLDLSQIAVKYGGGGHKGACGFRLEKLPF